VSKNFHESFAGGEVKPPSDRATGLVFAAVALIVAVAWRNSPTVLWAALGVAVMLAIVSLLAPALLKPLNRLWFKFGLLLHRIVNPIVMFAVFALVFVPGGAIMRLRADPLRVRRVRDTSSYWIDRKETGAPTGSSMTNQF
jgi:predicted membrane metal-binding protein